MRQATSSIFPMEVQIAGFMTYWRTYNMADDKQDISFEEALAKLNDIATKLQKNNWKKSIYNYFSHIPC